MEISTVVGPVENPGSVSVLDSVVASVDTNAEVAGVEVSAV